MGLSPSEFWKLSPREWGWLMAAAAAAPERLALDEAQTLARLYPDDRKPPSPACGRGAGGEGLSITALADSPSALTPLPHAGEGNTAALASHAFNLRRTADDPSKTATTHD